MLRDELIGFLADSPLLRSPLSDRSRRVRKRQCERPSRRRRVSESPSREQPLKRSDDTASHTMSCCDNSWLHCFRLADAGTFLLPVLALLWKLSKEREVVATDGAVVCACWWW